VLRCFYVTKEKEDHMSKKINITKKSNGKVVYSSLTGRNLRRMCLKAKATQKELSQHCGLHHTTLSKLESGASPISVENERRITQAVLQIRDERGKTSVKKPKATVVSPKVQAERKDSTPPVVSAPVKEVIQKHKALDVIEEWNLPYHLGSALIHLEGLNRQKPEGVLDELRKVLGYVSRYMNLVAERNGALFKKG
jgi:transcriptional regulator with XRE-family HTH domain